MISLEQIQAEQSRATSKAAREHQTPLTLWPADLATRTSMLAFCGEIPFLGTYVAKGYRRVNVQDVLPYHLDFFFVDASGSWVNTYQEPALSTGEFRDMLLELYCIDVLERPVGLNGRYDVSSRYSLGIWEAGQFQVHIALYEGV